MKINDSYIKVCKISPVNNFVVKHIKYLLNFRCTLKLPDALLTFLDECNLDIIELCYQYPEKAFKKYPQLSHLLTRINKYYVDKQITITGGTDSHGSDFGKILTGRY